MTSTRASSSPSTALEEFAARYAAHLEALNDKSTTPLAAPSSSKMAENCRHVPKYPARTFAEALQCILFLHIALCTESFENAISFGRLDRILHPYYQADVAAGLLDYERAQELLACFVLKVEEVILINDGNSAFQLSKLFETLSTDEALTIGGVDDEGNDCTNDVTYMILDTCELRPVGINMTARIHRKSPAKYVERIAEVVPERLAHAGAVQRRRLHRELQQHYAATAPEARNYAIVGCVEPNASNDHFGNTDCANVNVTLPLLAGAVGRRDAAVEEGPVEHLGRKARRLAARKMPRLRSEPKEARCSSWPVALPSAQEHGGAHRALPGAHERGGRGGPGRPCPHRGCPCSPLPLPLLLVVRGVHRERARRLRGWRGINTSGIQAIGMTDVADSLLAIEEVVYRKEALHFGGSDSRHRRRLQGEHHGNQNPARAARGAQVRG